MRITRHLVALAALLLSVSAASAQVIDRSTLTNKIMVGYQGWFAAPGDGNDPAMGWGHWGGNGSYRIDIWPDMTEYDPSDQFFAPNTILTNGGTPTLFSSYREGTVNTHFRWMQENGIDGAFLQRFIIETGNPNSPSQKHRDRVLQNVMSASAAYGRTWAVEYDISGGNTNFLYNDLVNDWTYLKNTYDVKNHPRYLYHNGKPVVIIWGIGVGDRPGTPPVMQQIIDWFKADGCFVFGGIARSWRTDTSAWAAVYRSLDGITPWTVGSYNSWAGINDYKTNTVVQDLAECNSRGILFMPTAWPRFQWDNMHGDPCGTSYFSPRGGQHLWDQVYAFKSAGVSCQFIAMMDEYDEGTAIMKCADNVPITQCWLTTDGLGNDWFLRLTNQAGRMLRGEIPVSQAMPISSGNSPDNAQMIGDTIPATMVAGQQYNVSITVRNTGETYWNAAAFTLGAVGDYDPLVASTRASMGSGEMLAPNQQKVFNLTMTAPNSSGTYRTDWRMVHEKIRWFGGTLTKQVVIGSDSTGPAPVANLVPTIADRQITLAWTNPTDADYTGTMVRYRTTGYPTSPTSGTLVCDRTTPPGTGDSFVHTGLTNGRTYYYAVYAYDGATRYSTRVTTFAVPDDITAPGPTQSFLVDGGDGRNVVTWTSPTDIDLAGVRLLFKTTGFPTSPTDGTVAYSGTGSGYTHTGLVNGTSYYYAAYAFDSVPNYSTASLGSAAPATGACFAEAFPYPDGNLAGNNGWMGAAINNEIQVTGETLRINGAAGAWNVSRDITCSPVGGIIWLQAKVKSGIGAATMWGLWLDDAAGANLARWYGTGTTARGRIGGTSSVTTVQNLTGGWDSIAAKVNTTANTTEFFFNGVSLGALSHSPAGDSVAKVRVDRLDYTPATGHYMFLDNVFVGQADIIAPAPVTSFSVRVGNALNRLAWTNPADADFAATTIRYKTSGYPTSIADGTQCYNGTAASYVHKGLTNGTPYYYSAFAYDGSSNYSAKTDANGTPVHVAPYDAKLLADNTPLTLTVGAVSAAFTNQFYVQSPDRLIGVRVDKANHGLGEGQTVEVGGTVLLDTTNDEKYIDALWTYGGITATVPATAMNNAAPGGADWNWVFSTKAGQKGVEGAIGPNNIGLLVRIWGKVTQIEPSGPDKYFYISDGSRTSDGTQTGTEANVGIRISTDPAGHLTDSYVIVTGIVSCFKDATGNLRPRILPKSIQKL